jgi:hypothetical protein
MATFIHMTALLGLPVGVVLIVTHSSRGCVVPALFYIIFTESRDIVALRGHIEQFIGWLLMPEVTQFITAAVDYVDSYCKSGMQLHSCMTICG